MGASPDPTNISTGPGVLMYAPIGTTEPTKRTASWPNGWIELGYTAEGHQFNSNPTIADVEVAELLHPVRRVTTRVDSRMQFAIAEITSAHLKLALNGGTLTDDDDVFTDAATTNADATLTSATAAFTASDVGLLITGVGIPALATILSVTNATTIELSANATATAAGVTITIHGRDGVYYEPPEVGDEIRHMIGWDSDDGLERLVLRRVIQAGNVQVARRKGADFARFSVDFALEQPGGGAKPFRHYFDLSRAAA